MLQAADVWFAYGGHRHGGLRPVLRGVTLTIPPNAFVGILGPNGAGKTTLLRLLAGTRQPQQGSVALDGSPMSRFSRAALARRMAVVPQETHLAFDYSVLEVATMGRYPHLGAFQVEGPADLTIVEEALSATGTLDLKDRPFSTLSGGEKQRVVIAAALAQLRPATPSANSADFQHSRHLLLDEPTASLDLAYQLEVAALLKTLHETQGIAVVVSTHDLNLAASLCHTLVLMREGIVLDTGATSDVLTRQNIRRLYGVEADVVDHPSGHRVVVPLTRVDPGAHP